MLGVRDIVRLIKIRRERHQTRSNSRNIDDNKPRKMEKGQDPFKLLQHKWLKLDLLFNCELHFMLTEIAMLPEKVRMLFVVK